MSALKEGKRHLHKSSERIYESWNHCPDHLLCKIDRDLLREHGRSISSLVEQFQASKMKVKRGAPPICYENSPHMIWIWDGWNDTDSECFTMMMARNEELFFRAVMIL
jgi:hypothetical protein